MKKASIYYDEIDGHLYPQWLLLPADFTHSYCTYTLSMPYERFFQEDFHESLAFITVPQGCLTRSSQQPTHYSINIEQLKKDILSRYSDSNQSLDTIQYFLITIDDLEEILQFNVRKIITN
ncbi:hypothetical protein BTS2_1193 [Bacillus sp. TS-2]|nr:hypothetical protein BTS2_1193 [Bacillus sp. TS-2]